MQRATAMGIDGNASVLFWIRSRIFPVTLARSWVSLTGSSAIGTSLAIRLDLNGTTAGNLNPRKCSHRLRDLACGLNEGEGAPLDDAELREALEVVLRHAVRGGRLND